MLSLSHAIVDELRSEMRASSVTYDVLAETSGVPRRTLVRHLTGETDITFAVAEKVSDALGVPMEEVIARAKMRRARQKHLVIDDGEVLDDPLDTPLASLSPSRQPSLRRPARRAAAGRADS